MRIFSLIVISLIGMNAVKNDGWVTQIQCNPPPCQPWMTMKPMQSMKPLPPLEPLPPMKPLEPLPPMKPMEPMHPMKPKEPFQWQWQGQNSQK